MSQAAVVTMIIGMVAIWGGLAASITLTLRRARRSGDAAAAPESRAED